MLPIMVREVSSRIKNTFAYYCELISQKDLDNVAICQHLRALFRELYTNQAVEVPNTK